MKSITLDWKGWWLLRTPMTDVKEMASGAVVYAVVGAKLKKVKGGVGCTARELIMFGSHKGGAAKEHFENFPKTAFGAFVKRRAEEIKKRAIVYLAAVPDDTPDEDLAAFLSLLYGAVPFAPKHHAMPAPYAGEPLHILNKGRAIGLPAEVFHSKGEKQRAEDAASSDDTVDPDVAMAMAAAQDAQATRILAPDDSDPGGLETAKLQRPGTPLATEKVEKPNRFIETEKIDKNKIAAGMDTEKIPKPPAGRRSLATERVPKPPGVGGGSAILGEAGREAT